MNHFSSNFFQIIHILSLIIMGLAFIFGITVFFGAPYVPSLEAEIRKMFKKLYPLSKKDLLIDMALSYIQFFPSSPGFAFAR